MDEKTYVPSLTLNPTQAAAQEAPAAPQLVVEEEKPAIEPEKLDIDRLSPEEQAAVREFAKQIDVTDTNLFSPTAPPRRRTLPISPVRRSARSARRTWARSAICSRASSWS